MTTSQHTSVAILLSYFIINPLVGFIMGFLSHVVLDSIEPQEYKIDIKKDKKMIFLEIILTLTLFFICNSPIMFWVVVGGLLPDIIDGILILINKERYYKGKHLFWFHKADKPKQEMSKRSTIIFSIVLFIIVGLVI